MEAPSFHHGEHLAATNCRPLNGSLPQAAEEIVRVLLAHPEDAFKDEQLQSKGGTKRKRPPYDPAWHLCMETAQLHAEKWSDPPGSMWVNYVRPADCFDPPPGTKTRSPRAEPRAQIVRFALDSTVLPLVTEVLPIAEQVRRALMAIHGKRTGRDGVRGRSETFSGKDADGKPLAGHRHAYFLPTDEDGDGRLDHLNVIAEDGFSRQELKTLDRLRFLNRGKDVPALRLLLLGCGMLSEFNVPPVHTSQRWVSATPFVVTRHPKKNGRKRDPLELLTNPHLFIEAVLREELDRFLRRRGEPDLSVVNVEPLYDPGTQVYRINGRHRPLEFKRFRSKPDDDGGRRLAGAFRITFNRPVRGQICLGYHSHFGLGSFMPEG